MFTRHLLRIAYPGHLLMFVLSLQFLNTFNFENNQTIIFIPNASEQICISIYAGFNIVMLIAYSCVFRTIDDIDAPVSWWLWTKKSTFSVVSAFAYLVIAMVFFFWSRHRGEKVLFVILNFYWNLIMALQALLISVQIQNRRAFQPVDTC